MLEGNDLQVINDVLEGYSMLEQVNLDLNANTGEVTFQVDFSDNFIPKHEWVKLHLQGISIVSVYADPAVIPPELQQMQHPSQPFMEFLACLFRAQPVYEWSIFSLPEDKPATVQPTWQLIQSPNYKSHNSLSVFVEMGHAGGFAWTMTLGFTKLQIARPFSALMDISTFIREIQHLTPRP